MLLYAEHQSVVFALAFSADGSTLASGSKDGAVIVRDAEGTPSSLCEAGPKSPAVHALAQLPDDSIAIGHTQGWDVLKRTPDAIRVTHMFDNPTTGLALLGPKLLAVGTGVRGFRTSGNLELWDTTTRQRREPFFQEPNGVRAVATCPAKGLVAWATGHCKVKLWDIRKQTPVEFPQPKDTLAVALAADGSTLAAAVDYTTRIYDVDRLRERVVLKGHKGRVETVAISPDGATVATGSWDETVRLWDAATGQELACYKWSIGKVFSLAYAPDGLRLAAGGDLGLVVVWDAE